MNSFDLLDNGYIRINAPMGVVRALASPMGAAPGRGYRGP